MTTKTISSKTRQRHSQQYKTESLALDKLVADAFVARKMRAGSPSLVLDLHDQGHAYDRKTEVS